MFVPKPLKQVGLVGIALMIWVMYSAGVLVPWINDYRPEIFGTEMSSDQPGPQIVVSAQVAQGTLVGAPWDGSDSFGGMLGPIFASVGFASPPDLTLCVVTLGGVRPSCYLKPRDDAQTSYCVDAYVCDWQVTLPEGKAFALVLLDVDRGLFGGGWDFVDAAFVLSDAGAGEFQEIDRLTRLFISYAAPVHLDVIKGKGQQPVWSVVYDRGEKYRREKMFNYFTMTELESHQLLVQSQLSVFPLDR